MTLYVYSSITLWPRVCLHSGNLTEWDTGLDPAVLKYVGMKSVQVPPDNFQVHQHLFKHHVEVSFHTCSTQDSCTLAHHHSPPLFWRHYCNTIIPITLCVHCTMYILRICYKKKHFWASKSGLLISPEPGCRIRGYEDPYGFVSGF